MLLAAEAGQGGGGLEAQRHPAVDPRHDLHQLHLFAVLLQHLAQRLHEPGAVGGVSPRVVACGTVFQSDDTQMVV